jgi:hypothetical protein
VTFTPSADRQFASGGERPIPELGNQLAKSLEYPLITFAEEGGENVLADPIAPEVIAAVAARERGGVEVDPMRLRAPADPIPAGIDTECR